jgi:hypothetical protein
MSTLPQDLSELKKLTDHDVYVLNGYEVYAIVPMEGGGFSRLPSNPTGLNEFTIILAGDAETARLSLLGRYKDHGAINAIVQKELGPLHAIVPKGTKPMKGAPAKSAPAPPPASEAAAPPSADTPGPVG